jgi:fucose permease
LAEAPTFHPATPGPTIEYAGAWKALGGFFITGLVLAFLGAILPSWGHAIRADYELVGTYFFCSSIGIVASVGLGSALVARLGIGRSLVCGSAMAAASFLYLGLVSPPAPPWARMIGLGALGFAAGLLHQGIFRAISPMYRRSPAATVNLGGTLFGIGSATVSLLISGAYWAYSLPATMVMLAMAPVAAAVIYAREQYPAAPAWAERPVRELLEEVRSPTAIFFALLLFFQFGNEWAIAGWLPLFLVHRLGMNPAGALILAALYWVSLLVGRIVSQSVLPRVHHGRLLFGAVGAAAFGCLILTFTNNRFGAISGILFLGAGFAPIYPLVVEKIGHRFPYFHPGFYNGIFSFAITGGLLAPCTLGYLAAMFDIRVVMLLPFFGTVIVLLLLFAIWLEPSS